MAYEGWALVEQMGFRQTVGKVSEAEVYGTKMLRLEVPVFSEGSGGTNAPSEFVTRFCGGLSLYQVTPMDEELALHTARQQSDPRPVKPTSYRIEDHSESNEDDDLPF